MNNSNSCKKLYKEYKFVCKKVYKCRLLTINNTISELNNHLEEIIIQRKSFESCVNKRIYYTDYCYGNVMDKGHQIQIDLLNAGITKCDIVVSNIRNIIEKKYKQLVISMDLISQIQ
jgi:hypothetical protein